MVQFHRRALKFWLASNRRRGRIVGAARVSKSACANPPLPPLGFAVISKMMLSGCAPSLAPIYAHCGRAISRRFDPK